MKRVKSLLMFAVAGTLVFTACKKDEDNGGNTSGDTTKPVATIMEPAEGESVNVGTKLHFHGMATDNSNLKSATVTLTMGTDVKWTETTTITGKSAEVHHDIPTDGMTAGAYAVTMTATDASNNTSAAVVRNVVLTQDVTGPVIVGATVKVPASGKLESGSTPNQVEFEITDDQELGEIVLTLNNTALTPAKDIWTKTITAAENAGKTSYKETVNVTFSGADVAGVNDQAKWVIVAKDAAGNETTREINVTIAF